MPDYSSLAALGRRPRAFVGAMGASAALICAVAGPASALPVTTTPSYEIAPFAGTGSSGAATAGPALSSALHSPQSVAVDSSGDVYIADSGNNEIEKVTPGGTLSIVAGTGTAGTPTPGTATSSDLDDPLAIALDSSGDLYIADFVNRVVEEVTPGGTLSIIAGDGSFGSPTAGTATASDLGSIEGLAVNASGDVFLSDHFNKEILEVDTSGNLSVYAGTGASGAPTAGPATSSDLNTPTGLSLDSAGDLYISDFGANDVEEVTPGGQLSIVAGNNTTALPVAGPATATSLGQPQDVAVDSLGNLLIDSSYGGQILDVNNSTGDLSVIAGTGAFGAPTYNGPATSSSLHAPEGVAVASDGEVYVANTNNNTVDELTPLYAPVSTSLPLTSGTLQPSNTVTTTLGTWSHTPTSYTYQWQDCDASGASCTNIAGATAASYAVTSTDVGHTLRVIVTATNLGGSASATSAASSVVSSALTTTTPTTTTPTTSTSTTTTSTTTPTTTTPTTTTPSTTPAPSGYAVTVPTATVNSGLSTDATGALSLPLQCPTIMSGVCVADGTLAMNLGGSAGHAITHAAAISSGVLAQFSGVQVQAGQQKLVAVKLSAAAIAYLRAHQIYRVRVTLTINNTLQDGQVVTSSQKMWLYVAGLTGCQAATGSVSAAGVGRFALGMTPAQAHKLASYTRGGYGYERYCIAGGQIRVAYGNTVLHRAGHVTVGEVFIALTGNRHYAVDGIAPRMTLSAASKLVHLGRPVVVGKNAWYIIAGAGASKVLKVQGGVVREVGVMSNKLIADPAKEHYLLAHM